MDLEKLNEALKKRREFESRSENLIALAIGLLLTQGIVLLFVVIYLLGTQ